MKDCILRLYRSAVDVGAEWEPGLADIPSPSMVFWGVNDPACPIDLAPRMADAIGGAEVVRVDANHWTPLQRPAESHGLSRRSGQPPGVPQLTAHA